MNNFIIMAEYTASPNARSTKNQSIGVDFDGSRILIYETQCKSYTFDIVTKSIVLYDALNNERECINLKAPNFRRLSIYKSEYDINP